MITRRRMLSAPQAAPFRSAVAKPADLRDTETAAPHRPGRRVGCQIGCQIGWMTAGLLASTALAGGAQAATGPGSVSINWDALDVVGGDTVGGDQAVSGLAADIARPVPPGHTGAAVFVPGTWPHSGAPNYGYMRLPRYYGGPVHTPFALTPYQPTDRPVLGADPLAAARHFAATSAAIGEIVPDAPLRSTVDAPDSFTAAVAAPATHPINLARASTLRRTPGGGYVVQYDAAVFSPVLLADAGIAADSPGLAATSSGSQGAAAAPAGPVAAFQPVQVAQLAPSPHTPPTSMTDGAPVTAYDEGPYGQTIPHTPRYPALPQRSFTNLNAPTIRARLRTRRMGPADFLLPTASPSYNAAGPRTRLTPPPRTIVPRQSYAPTPQSYALPSRAPQAAVAPTPSRGYFSAPATAAPYVGRYTSFLPQRGNRLEPPVRRPRSAAGQPAQGDAGGRPGMGIAANAPATRLSHGQLTSRIAPDLASGTAVPPPHYRPIGRTAAPAQGPVIISSATVGSAEPVAASTRRRPAVPPRQALPTSGPATSGPAASGPATSGPAASVQAAPISTAPVVPPSTTSLAPTTTPIAAPAAPQPKPSAPAVTQPRLVAPLPPAPSEPITTAAPPMPVVESPPVTGSSTISGTPPAPAAGRATPLPEPPVTVPSAPPPVPAMAAAPASTPADTAAATVPSATTLSALTAAPDPAPGADPAPTPLPDAPAATDPVVTADAAAPPAPGTAVGTQVATRPPANAPGGVLATVAFQPGDPELTDQARATLASMATDLTGDDSARIQLNAYAAAEADNPASARRLSLTRALAVRKYLIEQGIRSIRMDVRARGADVPDGSPERVDILLKTP